jgi:hypothetical protein
VRRRVGQRNRNTRRLAESYIESLSSCVNTELVYFETRSQGGRRGGLYIREWVQSGGSMADETIVRIIAGNKPLPLTNVNELGMPWISGGGCKDCSYRDVINCTSSTPSGPSWDNACGCGVRRTSRCMSAEMSLFDHLLEETIHLRIGPSI